MRLNERGQEFDVFKLVIAAIVAVAILGVLLSLMGGLIAPGQEPLPEIARVVKNNVNAPGSYGKTNTVSIPGNQQIVTSEAIASKTGTLSAEQICLAVGEPTYAEKFEVEGKGTDLESLWHRETATVQARFGVLCASGTRLGDWIEQTIPDWVDKDCKCTSEQSRTTCCIVGIVSPT